MGFGVGGLDYPRQIKPAGARWVKPGWTHPLAAAATALVNGRIHYMPIFVDEATTYDRVAVRVLTLQAGQTLELRLFAWQDGVPGALIEDFGNVSLAAVAIVEIVISRGLPRGYYFLARRTAGGVGAVLQGIGLTSGFTSPASGVNLVTAGNNMTVSTTVDAAWADPAPAPAAMADDNDICIVLRES